jgi:hypothetical protein
MELYLGHTHVLKVAVEPLPGAALSWHYQGTNQVDNPSWGDESVSIPISLRTHVNYTRISAHSDTYTENNVLLDETRLNIISYELSDTWI